MTALRSVRILASYLAKISPYEQCLGGKFDSPLFKSALSMFVYFSTHGTWK